MEILKILAGPVIGAVIGYTTNYIAVKMLFKPLYPVKIGNFTLPFTPGVIPKRKKEMAQALGTMVSNSLITKEDLEKALLSDGMKQSVTDGIVEYVINKPYIDMTFKDTLNCCMSEKDYEDAKIHLGNFLSEKLVAGLLGFDLGTVIADEARTAIKEKVQGSLLAMMVNDKTITLITEPLGKKVKEYIENHGVEKIQPVIAGELESLENQTISSVLGKIQLNEKQIKEIAGRIYTDCISSTSDAIIKQIDVAGIVRNKVLDMDVKDIEKLVLSVMKNELDTVVNLGAGLGFIIGLLNLLF